MDSIGPAPTGPVPETFELSEDDVDQLVGGTGGPTAWFEIAELLDRIRMEAAVEPDDLWVRTHVAVAAAAARKANLVPDPTAGRPSRPLRLGAVAAATTTLLATMGLAAADTLPEPLQSVASHVASLVGVDMPDGHDRDGPLVQLPDAGIPEPTGLESTPPSTAGPGRDRQAAPDQDPDPDDPAERDRGVAGEAKLPDWFSRRPIGDHSTSRSSDWRRDLDRFTRRDITSRSASSASTGSTPWWPDLSWMVPAAGDPQADAPMTSLPELIERWSNDRLRPYTEPARRPSRPVGPSSGGQPADDEVVATADPPPTLPRRRPATPPTTAPPSTVDRGTTPEGAGRLPRRHGSGTERDTSNPSDPAGTDRATATP
jgi:hypothetical protein